MPNPVLERLHEQREQQVQFIDHLLAEVDEAGRDLVEAERQNLETARARLGALDDQIKPLAEFEALRESNVELPAPTGRRSGGGRTEPRSMAAAPLTDSYPSVGHFLADYCASLSGIRGQDPDPAAVARMAAVRETIQLAAHQTTKETPGLLPTPIVGPVLDLIDARRPLISSLGPRNMAGIPGLTFHRPKVTQHTRSGPQGTAGKSPDDEKKDLPSQPMKVDPVAFTKVTHGGWVNVSRQDIDWTSPEAWNILTRDLANVYGLSTEAAVATAMAAAVTQTEDIDPDATEPLKAWAAALYKAAAKVYAGCSRLPDMIWVSVDMWATVGAVVDQARLIFPPGAGPGRSELRTFEGNMFALPRVVVPSYPKETAILGVSELYEVYEERIGLLQAIEPKVLGVELAYGGYLAHGTMEAKGFCKIVPKGP